MLLSDEAPAQQQAMTATATTNKYFCSRTTLGAMTVPVVQINIALQIHSTYYIYLASDVMNFLN